MHEPDTQAADALPLLAYKVVLQKVIESRPSGTRQRLAEALGKNRSFITQISNPAYATPVPAQHIETIFQICHFSNSEKAEFLSAYRASHPSRFELIENDRSMRVLMLELPDFGSPAINRKVDEAINAVVREMTDLLSASHSKSNADDRDS